MPLKNLAIVLVIALSITACQRQTEMVSAEAVNAEESVEVTQTDFDPQEFLCELAGQTRRTPSERAWARGVISRELRDIGLQPREQEYRDCQRVFYPRPCYYDYHPHADGVNLSAELPATASTNDWIIVGAHYDTFGPTPGADDNGSGVTAVLMVARELARMPARSANVAFVFFDQEEDGLVGSAAYARWLLTTDRHVVVLHNIDMVGWDAARDRDVTLMFGETPEPRLDGRFMELYGRAAEVLRADTARSDRPGRLLRDDTNRGEHITFHMHGLSALSVIEDSADVGDFNPHYHSTEDNCRNIDYDYLRMCADLVTVAVTEQLR
ncbi:MAG: M28 family metallopeptidase [Patescibacteria group bacterium]